MACFSGPEIVNDGLVFAYDMSNSEKSWFGRPTTNLIGPNNDSTNIYMPSNRPYSGLPHSQSGNITTEVPPPIPGQTVYKIIDDAVDTQNARYSIRVDMTNTWIDYDKTYIWSCFVWLPQEYAGRWTGTFTRGIYQNTSGTDWHGTRGYDVTYNYYSAGSILSSGPYGISSGIDRTKLNQWQRIWSVFTPLTANIQLPQNSGNDNNKWVAGFMRVDISNAVNGGTPYHLYLSGGQIEEGNFVTDFVTNSRDVTDSIKDLTNNNVLTPSNLSYDDYDTFSFPGNGIVASAIRSNKTRTTLFTDPNIYSYEVVCKRNGVGSTATIVIGNQGYNSGILMTTAGQFVASAWYSTAPWTVATPYPTTSVVANDTWAHVVMTFNKNGFERIYLNGVLQGSLDVSGFNTSAGGNWYGSGSILVVGGDNFAAYSFSGTIAVAKMYNKELTDAEIKQNFEALRGRFGI